MYSKNCECHAHTKASYIGIHNTYRYLNGSLLIATNRKWLISLSNHYNDRFKYVGMYSSNNKELNYRSANILGIRLQRLSNFPKGWLVILDSDFNLR
jgi:hypothetical protein